MHHRRGRRREERTDAGGDQVDDGSLKDLPGCQPLPTPNHMKPSGNPRGRELPRWSCVLPSVPEPLQDHDEEGMRVSIQPKTFFQVEGQVKPLGGVHDAGGPEKVVERIRVSKREEDSGWRWDVHHQVAFVQPVVCGTVGAQLWPQVQPCSRERSASHSESRKIRGRLTLGGAHPCE